MDRDADSVTGGAVTGAKRCGGTGTGDRPATGIDADRPPRGQVPLAGVVEPEHAVPITERVLARLGRPRWLWVSLWALIPLVTPVIFVTAVRSTGYPITQAAVANILLTQAALAYMCFVMLWGTAALARLAIAAEDDVATIVGRESGDVFRRIGSVRGPLALSALIVAISAWSSWTTYGPVPPLAILPLMFVYMLAIQTFVWVYLAILAGLDRLGRQPLSLEGFPQDRTLGLETLGSLASTGLGFLLIAAVPLLLAASDEPVTLAIALVIVAIAVGIFVLSMTRLHGQMAMAKRRYVELARRLYADAYQPIRESPSMERLEAQAGALRAAQSLDDRAQGLPTWPIGEGALRFIVVVITGVVTSVIVRGLFAALGF